MDGSFNQLIQIFLLNSMKTKLINNYPKVFLFWITLLLTFISSSCIEIYENDPTLTAKVLMVEGFITNQLEADTIEVNFSNGRGVKIVNSQLFQPTVRVIICKKIQKVNIIRHQICLDKLAEVIN
jgi:hypothetical protein